MNDKKYFLVNGNLPCICTCHKACLRRDLINRGYNVITMEQISEKQYFKIVNQIRKKGKELKFAYTYF